MVSKAQTIETSTDEPKEAQNKPTTEDVEKKPKYSVEELLSIFDDIIFQGVYTEEVSLNKKLKVTFRTRTAKETADITSDIDSQNFQWVVSANQHRAFLNLVYSLERYGPKNLSDLPLEEKKKFVGNLPTVVVGALSDKLVDFDSKTDEACRVGESNF